MIYRLVSGFLLAALVVAGQNRQPEYMETFRALSDSLANRDADVFLDQFDSHMPGIDPLRDEIRDLTATTQEIGSTIDVITDEGDGQKRSLELDWLLTIDENQPRRQIVKCQIERQGKNWKITRLEPVTFFRK